jgi:hypothetical protein
VLDQVVVKQSPSVAGDERAVEQHPNVGCRVLIGGRVEAGGFRRQRKISGEVLSGGVVEVSPATRRNQQVLDRRPQASLMVLGES